MRSCYFVCGVESELYGLDRMPRRPIRIRWAVVGELADRCETRFAVVARARARSRCCWDTGHASQSKVCKICGIEEGGLLHRGVRNGLGVLVPRRMSTTGDVPAESDQELIHGCELLWSADVERH